MSSDAFRNAALGAEQSGALLDRMRARFAKSASDKPAGFSAGAFGPEIGQSCDFAELGDVKKIQIHKTLAKRWGVESLYFLPHEGVPRDVVVIQGRRLLNFSTYDYLGFNGSPELNQAALEAMQTYGSSASGSRPTSGERPVHRKLETALAELYGAEDAVVYVSGHATNVWAIQHLFKNRDVVFYDSLCHNSIIHGAHFSGAARFAFPHNDLDALDALMAEERPKKRRALIVTEGLFSMDGDVPDLPRLIEIKKRRNAFLMVDEAHSLGVLGRTGKGLAEHCGVDPKEVDLWMGTLSKTLCGCGGYIAGSAAVVECLKWLSPGFLYSVGAPPPLVAVNVKALERMRGEPERVRKLQASGRFFCDYARSKGLDVGRAQGHAVVPVMVGGSIQAAVLARRLFERGIYALPIIFPVVEENAARIRFFLSALHSEDQLRAAVDAAAEELPEARRIAAAIANQSDDV